jgi:hypothetical protein
MPAKGSIMNLGRALTATVMLALIASAAYVGGLRAATAQQTQSPAGTPMPLPSSVATSSPLFADRSYVYRGVPNDPHEHPVPPEYQSGPRRDEHIYCIDWSREPRTSREQWTYYITTCQCYPSAVFKS